MARNIQAHSRRQTGWAWVATGLVIAGASVAGGSTVAATPAATPTATPATTPAQPPAWQLPVAAAKPALVADAQLPTTGHLPTSTGIDSALDPLLATPALAGDQLAMIVTDAATGRVLFTRNGSDAAAPASTAKLAVAAAALQVLGPEDRFTTRVIQGAAANAVVLVGGGDPTLAGPDAVGTADPGYPEPARLTDLAQQTAAALRAGGIARVTVGYDASLFTGASAAAGWKPTYITEGDVAPVTALEVDEGRPNPAAAARTASPTQLAAADFASLLTADGISVIGTPQPAPAAAGARTLAAVQSPTLGALVQRMLDYSDNDLAEALARQVARATGRPATFEGGVAAIRSALTSLGIDPTGWAMVDASGLSTLDRAPPRILAQILDAVLQARHPSLAPILAGLPVAGFSGTLAGRYTAAPAAAAAGVVRAKTGTLDDVVALAGYVDDVSGRVLAFSVMANAVRLSATATTQTALDDVAAGLYRCGC